MTADDSAAAPGAPQPPRSHDAALVRLTLDDQESILAAVPHLLGFYPSRSLVVLGIGGRQGRVRVTFRYDLPDPADGAVAAEIADHAVTVLRQQRLSLAVLVGYGPAALAAPVLEAAADWFDANGIQQRDVLLADGGRYWCMLCQDSSCCPPEGRLFDPGSHPAAAALAEAGLQALPDRAALARTLRGRAGSAATIRAATRRAERRLRDLGAGQAALAASDRSETGTRDTGRQRADSHEAGGQETGGQETGGQETGGQEDGTQEITAREGRAAVRRAIGCYQAGGAIESADELAWLAVLLRDLRVRDDAWARMSAEHADAHIRLWTDVVKGAAAEYIPGPAALLAFAAWQAGHGALASVAIDRALAARPGYSMALLIASALQAGLPPSAARLPMTPEQVASSYAAAARAGSAGGRRSKSGRANSGGTRAASQPDSARSRSAGARARARGASKRPSG
jgi:hypothetical protein